MKKKITLVALIALLIYLVGCADSGKQVEQSPQDKEIKSEALQQDDDPQGDENSDVTADDESDSDIAEPSPSPTPTRQPIRVVFYEKGKYIGYAAYEMDGEKYKSFEVHYSDQEKEKEYGLLYNDFRYESDSYGNDLYSWNISLSEDELYYYCDGQRFEYEYDNSGNVKKVKSIPISTKGGKYEERPDAASILTYKYKNGVKTDAYIKSGTSVEHHHYNKNEELKYSEKKSKYDPYKRIYDSKGRVKKEIYDRDSDDGTISNSVRKKVYKYDLKDSSGNEYYTCKNYFLEQSYGSGVHLEVKTIDYYYVDENGTVILEELKDAEGMVISSSESEDYEIEENERGKLFSVVRSYKHCDYHGVYQKMFNSETRELRDSEGRVIEKTRYSNLYDFVDLHMGFTDKEGLMEEEIKVRYIYDESEAQDSSIYKDYVVKEESTPDYILNKQEY